MGRLDAGLRAALPPLGHDRGMSAPATDTVTTRARLGYDDVLADDGTRLRTWTNDPDGVIAAAGGPTVLLCNGLGTNPWVWPALLEPGCGVRVVSWSHRGTGGSDRPADPAHVGIDHFVGDALSVLDHHGLARVVVMGWSMGVNTAFELALQHPERVAGVFAVAGVPGDSFATMLGPLRLPGRLAHHLGVGLARAVRPMGRALTPVTTRLPIGRRAVQVLSHSGFMLPVADVEATARAVREFLTTPVEWYAHLAIRSSEHPRVPLSRIDVPAFFVAGRWDVLAGSRSMATAAARLREATYVELDGTHFLPLEQPDVVHGLLVELLERVEA